MSKPNQDANPDNDWKIFRGDGSRHLNLATLPDPPPWRFGRATPMLEPAKDLDLDSNRRRAEPFQAGDEMILAVNTALYLRRPLLITGKPGTGKSTLIYKVADELSLGPVIRWPISSRSTVRGGLYEYDAVGRLQSGEKAPLPVEAYVTLGPLGTALRAKSWPRPLLIDEIDKSDLDFASDLLNVIEEGEFEIPELWRLPKGKRPVRDFLKQTADIEDGRVQSGQFPFVVMTSNAEREFPPPFLRRCVRLRLDSPGPKELAAIVASQLSQYAAALDLKKVDDLVKNFDQRQKKNLDVSTDQLLNAVFLTVAMQGENERKFSESELEKLREMLLKQLSGPGA
jgi:MoxR-like ATPase